MATTDVVADMRGQVEGTKITLSDQLEKIVPQVERATGRRDLAERLVRIALTEVRKTPQLAECTIQSLMGAILQSAQLRLDPGSALGHCWLIPMNNFKPELDRKVMEVEWWLGYKGLVELAHRSGQLAGITADVVREGDRFQAYRGTDGGLSHEVDWRATRAERGEPYCAYAHARLLNGGDAWEVLTMEQLDERRKLSRSSSKKTSPWNLWWDRMAAKSAVHALGRWLPSCPDYADGVAADQRVIRWDPENPEQAPTVDDTPVDLLAAVPTSSNDDDSEVE